MYKLMFYLTVITKYYVTVTLGWHDSRSGPDFSVTLSRKKKHNSVILINVLELSIKYDLWSGIRLYL